MQDVLFRLLSGVPICETYSNSKSPKTESVLVLAGNESVDVDLKTSF